MSENNNNNISNNKKRSDGWYRLSIRNETAQKLIDLRVFLDESYEDTISRLIKEHEDRKSSNNNNNNNDPLSLKQIDQALTEITIRKEKS